MRYDWLLIFTLAIPAVQLNTPMTQRPSGCHNIDRQQMKLHSDKLTVNRKTADRILIICLQQSANQIFALVYSQPIRFRH